MSAQKKESGISNYAANKNGRIHSVASRADAMKQAGNMRESSSVINTSNAKWTNENDHLTSKHAKMSANQIEQLDQIIRDPETEQLTPWGLKLKVTSLYQIVSWRN